MLAGIRPSARWSFKKKSQIFYFSPLRQNIPAQMNAEISIDVFPSTTFTDCSALQSQRLWQLWNREHSQSAASQDTPPATQGLGRLAELCRLLPPRGFSALLARAPAACFVTFSLNVRQKKTQSWKVYLFCVTFFLCSEDLSCFRMALFQGSS